MKFMIPNKAMGIISLLFETGNQSQGRHRTAFLSTQTNYNQSDLTLESFFTYIITTLSIKEPQKFIFHH